MHKKLGYFHCNLCLKNKIVAADGKAFTCSCCKDTKIMGLKVICRFCKNPLCYICWMKHKHVGYHKGRKTK